VDGFYTGGTGSLGSVGPNHGVTFVGFTSLIDLDAGGNGNFANEPSPSTVAFCIADPSVINVPAGFHTGMSLMYTSAAVGTVRIWDGLDGTGTQLATFPVLQQAFDGGTGDPTGQFTNWTAGAASFVGTALSITFEGLGQQTGIDNIVLRLEVPAPPPPPPPPDEFWPAGCQAWPAGTGPVAP